MQRVDVVVVGAGLTGLRAAGLLGAAGLDVAVLEASDQPGGRVRSDRVDGLVLDRGFQVVNTGYPAIQACLEFDALELRSFVHGARVVAEESRWLLADPLRTLSLAGLTAPVGTAGDKARLAAVSLRDALAPAALLKGGAERSTETDLRRRGFSRLMVDRLWRPFLSGVFLDPDLGTSSTLFHLVWRAFVRGTQAVPAAGMQAVADQLAGRLPAGALRTGRRVESIVDGVVTVSGADAIRADAVVVATDGPAAAGLLPRLPVPAYRGVTTYYHLADGPPTDEAVILLDGSGETPIVNSVVLTNAAPSYASGGRVLVSSSILGADPVPESEIRNHLARLYGVSTASWEHVRTYPIATALPAQPPPLALRQPVRLADRLFVAGDHRDTASAQGALVSGRRVATAVLRDLRGGS